MKRLRYEVGGTVTLDPNLTDAEKVAALVEMLTRERAQHRRARIRWAQTLTRVSTEWNDLFDECVEVTDSTPKKETR